MVSGDFSGWNLGLAVGGWGGLLIAFILMGLMYTCMVFGLAELSSTLPTAGAGYGFARRALGPLGGFATGMAVLIEYAVAPAAIATFIGGYIEALGLFGLTNSWPVYLVTYVVFIGIHLWGVGEALKLIFGITAIAVVALVITAVALVPGTAGAAAMSTSESPLPEALRAAYGEHALVADIVNYAGLAGLVASFFSIVFAYSRQLFALSRAGYLPKVLSLTSSRNTPWVALLVPGTIGFLLATITGNGGLLINIAVFGATLSYVLLNLSHIMLRIKEPDLPRGYRTPGGAITTGIALVLAVVALGATFVVDVMAASITASIFLAAIGYFWFYSRHRLVASAPEEEFALLENQEADLK